MTTEQAITPLSKVMIAVLHTGQIRWEIAAWLAYITNTERRARFMIRFFGQDAHARPVSSNRNRILLEVPADFDGVIMIDEDTVPHHESFDIALLGLDVVLAPTPVWRGDDERGPIIVNLVPLERIEHGYATMPIGADKVVEIKEGGSGMIYISRAVIDHQSMRAPFKFGYDNDGLTIVGEDHKFCRRARAAGFKVHAALKYIQGHVKSINLRAAYEMFTPQEPKELDLILTGSGRCGTGYASRWLSSAGLPCGHEAIWSYLGADGAREKSSRFRNYHADSSWLAAPYLDHVLLAGVPIVHITRHPAKVIASWIRIHPQSTPPYWNYVLDHCPEIGEIPEGPTQGAARYVLWNEMIERKAEGRDLFRWRIEDQEDGLLAWLADRGLLDPAKIERGQLYPDRSYNHKPGDVTEIDLDEVGEPWRTRLLEMSERYGYEWE